jgi:hypothetical protein
MKAVASCYRQELLLTGEHVSEAVRFGIRSVVIAGSGPLALDRVLSDVAAQEGVLRGVIRSKGYFVCVDYSVDVSMQLVRRYSWSSTGRIFEYAELSMESSPALRLADLPSNEFTRLVVSGDTGEGGPMIDFHVVFIGTGVEGDRIEAFFKRWLENNGEEHQVDA